MPHRRTVQKDYDPTGQYPCWYCGYPTIVTHRRRQLPNPNLRTREHLIPKRYQGPNTLDNLVIACYSCNQYMGMIREQIVYLEIVKSWKK